MVVRLKEGQFTAGDMIFMVRSRRRARADPRFYGAGATEVKRVIKEGTEQNPTTRLVSEEGYQKYLKDKEKKEKEKKETMKEEQEPSSNTTTTTKASTFKESDEYFNPVTMVVQEEEVRESKESNLNERARKILADIEEDMRKINYVQSLKRG
jgi:hypothetical protein